MNEVFKYARNVHAGDILYDGRVIRDLKIVLVLDGHPMHCVPAEEVLLVRTQHYSQDTDRLLRQLHYAEAAAQSIKIQPGTEADEALRRLKRLQGLIEQACANAATA